MLVADVRCNAVYEATGGDVDAVYAAEDEAAEIQDRFNACARRILKEPVRSPADLMLLAEATYWWLYSEPAGLWAPDAEAKLDGDPVCVIDGGVAEEALLALLKGVRDVGMRARSRRRQLGC
jgi:AcrR family transcriptional regulator